MVDFIFDFALVSVVTERFPVSSSISIISASAIAASSSSIALEVYFYETIGV